MRPSKTTPMIKQYLDIKDQYPDAILFYRMGDFYEMFFEDAHVASRALEITLTSRNKNEEKPVPMCGVPYKAARGYISRLIEQGHKVAVCDQVEDPAQAKGLVKREVVQVVTPGMIVDNELLDAKENNYLMAVSYDEGQFGLAHLDISTGSFRLCQTADEAALADEIGRISPSEVLLPESSAEDAAFAPVIRQLESGSLTKIEKGAFDYRRSKERLEELFKVVSLEGYGCRDMKPAVQAAGALLVYVKETQKQDVEHLSGIQTYFLDAFLRVDDQSCRNLELLRNIRTGNRKGTLIGILDRTVTAMGSRRLVTWIRYPLLDVKEIGNRHEAIEEAVGNLHCVNRIREYLKSVYDLERLSTKVSMGRANARDLVAIKKSLQQLPGIFEAVSEYAAPAFQWQGNRELLADSARLLDNAIREDAPPTIHEGGMIREGYNSELDELISLTRDGKGWLVDLEGREKNATGISALKVRFNKVFGYYIEVPKAQAASVPEHYVRKQTLVNAERYITDELKKFESKVLGAEEERAKLEHRLFEEIRETVAKRNKIIQNIASFLSRLDCLTALAEVADVNGYCRPSISTDGEIVIEDGRHPVVEKLITGERFVPNTIGMDNEENQILMITGPNMAGKSTILRQVALTVIMAQMGSFVPAGKATIALTDRIFTRVGALDNLSHGQSTFMVEMQETANILHHATDRSLVIMDEIGRGTSTYDGLSIAWAVAEYLHDLKGRGVKTMFATHYHELTELADTHRRVKNYNIAVKEWNDEIIFLRKLQEGGTNRSYGIQVARLAGIPEPVIRKAKKILFDIEGNQDAAGIGRRNAGEKAENTKNTHTQLQLFRDPRLGIIEKIRHIDISRTTPLDALNVLSDVLEKMKDIPEP